MPTILDHVYRRSVAGLKGRSLSSPLPDDRIVFSYGLQRRDLHGRHELQHVAAYSRNFKYLHRYPDGRGCLYDLRRDPAATRDVAAASPAEAARLRRAVQEAFFQGSEARPE